MMALVMIVTLSQCKKQDVETDDNTAKIKVSCTIPINKDGKTDFASDGSVNWSKETERIYLAIPATQELVELTSTTQEGGSTLTFTGSVQADLLTDGEEYEVWYLGRSEESKLNNGSITGSIATQSGNLSDLGYHHIAMTTVTASVGDGITLTFDGSFKNQVAIVRLGEESANTSRLRGNAIIGTEYALQYNETEDKFELAVTENATAKIQVSAVENSYVVLFPNEEPNVELISNSGKKVTFLNGVKAGSIYTVGWEESGEVETEVKVETEVTEVTATTAVCHGKVTADNCSNIYERGFYYCINGDYTNVQMVRVDTDENEYSYTLTGLQKNTAYTVWAYVLTSAGKYYPGNEFSFTTMKYDFSNMGSHAVDLGLPSGVMWSDCNIGAEWAVEQAVWPQNIYGNYFMWACKTSSTSFGEDYYPEYAKECDFSYSGDIRYDAATNLFGGDWRTPTKADFKELEKYCTREYVTKDGINCLKFTGENGNSIYLPFGGVYDTDGEFQYLGERGYYLMANFVYDGWYDDYASYTRISNEGDYMEVSQWMEYCGTSLRPVIGLIQSSK